MRLGRKLAVGFAEEPARGAVQVDPTRDDAGLRDEAEATGGAEAPPRGECLTGRAVDG